MCSYRARNANPTWLSRLETSVQTHRCRGVQRDVWWVVLYCCSDCSRRMQGSIKVVAGAWGGGWISFAVGAWEAQVRDLPGKLLGLGVSANQCLHSSTLVN